MTRHHRHDLSLTLDPGKLAEELRAMRDYWDGKRGCRAMPRRRDIDPVELRAHLPFLGLIDVLEDGREFRFRLLGTEFQRLFGRDSTGKTLTEVYGEGDPEVLCWMRESYAATLRSRRPVLRSGSMRAVAKEFIGCDSLLLPLSEDGDRINMILGRTVFRFEA